jgi:hypothetical protein
MDNGKNNESRIALAAYYINLPKYRRAQSGSSSSVWWKSGSGLQKKSAHPPLEARSKTYLLPNHDIDQFPV